MTFTSFVTFFSFLTTLVLRHILTPHHDIDILRHILTPHRDIVPITFLVLTTSFAEFLFILRHAVAQQKFKVRRTTSALHRSVARTLHAPVPPHHMLEPFLYSVNIHPLESPFSIVEAAVPVAKRARRIHLQPHEVAYHDRVAEDRRRDQQLFRVIAQQLLPRAVRDRPQQERRPH